MADDEPESPQLTANRVIPCVQVIKACDLGLEGSQFLTLYLACAVCIYIVKHVFYMCVHMDYSSLIYGVIILPTYQAQDIQAQDGVEEH